MIYGIIALIAGAYLVFVSVFFRPNNGKTVLILNAPLMFIGLWLLLSGLKATGLLTIGRLA